jgi:hypothetical protein
MCFELANINCNLVGMNFIRIIDLLDLLACIFGKKKCTFLKIISGNLMVNMWVPWFKKYIVQYLLKEVFNGTDFAR